MHCKNYVNRPPYSQLTIDKVASLANFGTVLDVGAGIGELTRRLSPMLNQIDANDWSTEMIKKAKSLPGGKNENIKWIPGKFEENFHKLRDKYDAIICGQSLHWLDWALVFPKFRNILTDKGLIIVVERPSVPKEWASNFNKIVAQYSTIRNYEPFDLQQKLKKHVGFEKIGEANIELEWEATIDTWLSHFHSFSSLNKSKMGEQNSLSFDQEIKKMLEPFIENGSIPCSLQNEIWWGR